MSPAQRRVGWLIALLLVASAAVACAPTAGERIEGLTPGVATAPESEAVLGGKVAQAPTQAIPVHLTILHTNDVRGAVDPCGWGVPQGGLARRATLVQQVRDEADGPVLVLDAGNTLMGQTLAMQSEGRVLVDAMNLMGYDALAVGTLELARGVDTLLERAAEAEFAILSANLVWTQTGEPVVEPYILWEQQGLRVAIIGVTYAEALRGLERLSPGVELLDSVERVAHYVAELRPQADIVVVLSHLGIHEDKALAQAVEGIDIIVGGRSRQLMRAPELVKTSTTSTAIIQVGYDGEWLGRLDVSGQIHALDMPTHEILFMRPDVPEDPAMLSLIDEYRERYGAEE